MKSTEPDIANHRYQAVVRLHDTPGTTMGALKIGFASEVAANDAERVSLAES